ncbi:MAG TPA: glycosyltransferase 87 family protein [Thermoleophilaceae bacterium]
MPGLRSALLLTGLCLLLVAAPGAALAAPPSQAEAIQIAVRVPQVQAEIANAGSIRAQAVRAGGHWQVLFFDREDEARAEVDIDLLTGRVLTVLTGTKASFPLARGPQSGYAKRTLNAVWIWVPMTLLFVGVFFDRRRPWRLLHLDLVAIAGLSISFAFWMKGDLDASVPLVYPTLVYVLVRMLFAGFWPRGRDGPISPLAPQLMLGLTLALLALRVGLTLGDGFVSDIGYASAAGADRILDGLELYTRGGAHFDTYGPLAYLLYIPFVVIWPFHESQTYPPAAEAAAIAWELLTVGGLVVLGRKLRLGWTLALAWTACPFTALALVNSSNDGLVAATLVWALVAVSSPALRGLLGGASAAAKIAPGFVLPVYARGTGRLDARRMLVCAAAGLVVIAASLIPLLPPGGLGEFYDATIGFQLHRASPFSIWSQHPSLDQLQTVLKAASLALALALALFPRGTRTLAQMAALAAAVLVAAELPLTHWFYLYVPWFLPLYCLALFIEHEAGERPGASPQQPHRAGAPASYTARS